MGLALWFLAGGVGSALGWWAAQATHQERANVGCPSPLGILIGALVAVTGPVVLGLGFVGALFALAALLDDGDISLPDNWFTRPLCKRKDRT